SLCGKCTEVCPVKINIHQMLLANRRDAVKEGLSPAMERIGWRVYTKAITKRSWIDKVSGKIKNRILKLFFKTYWGKRRELPAVSEKSFSQQWKEKNQI